MTTTTPRLQDLPHSERRQLLEQLSERQNHRCCWCGRPFDGYYPDPESATFEHIRPRTFGGDDSPSNLVVACHECNQKRGGMHYLGFLAWNRAAAWDSLPACLENAQATLEEWYQRHWSFVLRERMTTRLARLDWHRSVDGLPPLHRTAWLAALRESCFEEQSNVYVDPFLHGLSRDPGQVIDIASEMQRHHCAICAASLNGPAKRPGGAYPVVIDPERPSPSRHADNIIVVCIECKSVVDGAQTTLASWIERQSYRMGSIDSETLKKIRKLEHWLSDNFNGAAKKRVRKSYEDDLEESLLAGVTPKTWLAFLMSFKEACEEFGLAS